VSGPVVEVLPDAEAVARRGAEVIAAAARDAVAARGAFSLAVSGGRTPWLMFEALGAQRVPWDAATLWQVDERIAPAGDPARNLTLLLETLPPAAGPCLRPMPVEDPDPEAAADRYAAGLPERLNLVHLGLGPDGHTASLVPGDPALEVRDRAVAVTGSYLGHRRMTLTYPVLDAAARILWVVTGADKADALARLLAGDRSIPAGRVEAASALVLADAAAAG
jgi:6-phosphogluconolactonase